jgi:hypothetical protein
MNKAEAFEHAGEKNRQIEAQAAAPREPRSER